MVVGIGARGAVETTGAGGGARVVDEGVSTTGARLDILCLKGHLQV